jgi:hypothetical protein
MLSLVKDVMTSVRERAQFTEVILVKEAHSGPKGTPDFLTPILAQILERVINDEFALDSRAFTVKVAAGVATISGVMSSAPVVFNLLDAIRLVDGVVAVRDRLSYP